MPLPAAAQSMADEMDFSVLYDGKKKQFSIGCEEAEGGLSKYNYDLFASEARAAVFVAVAKGEAAQESWFHLKEIIPLLPRRGCAALVERDRV